jgi:hypothetical protein
MSAISKGEQRGGFDLSLVAFNVLIVIANAAAVVVAANYT